MTLDLYPSFITTEESRRFWQNQKFTTLDTLRSRASSSIFVAIDCEGQEGHLEGVTSIGLAFLTPSPSRPWPWPWLWRGVDLDTVTQYHGIRSFSIQISDRKSKHKPEFFRYGAVESVPLAELEDHICGLFAETLALESSCPTRKQIILVGWSIHTELRAILALFPRLLSHLDNWADLAEIVAVMAGIRSKKRRSLRDTMLTLGFAHHDKYTVQDILRPHDHDAGMDATRTTAAMLALMASPLRQITIPEWTMNEKEARKRLARRPPRSEFPHAVRICVDSGAAMPIAISSPARLDIFVRERFERGEIPAAVAICPPKALETQKTHGWVCFAELKVMESFVGQLQGCVVDGKRLRLCIDGPFEVLERRQNARQHDDMKDAEAATAREVIWLDEFQGAFDFGEDCLEA
ncbi:hypothetical protein B0T19DRAFT_288797 [Cercophora scortea]|uniref:Gfd2/YDR514C-like C-terminal domain-containing protein n=1 Tax=Cercophora scortea TaxID=314031 RepID=A0AAE0I2J9_9PEZI|nr:hypothetical protein B0T19DRAFT_288797 [Cercophora scortea]